MRLSKRGKMTGEVEEIKIEKTSQNEEKKSQIMLSAATLVVAIALIAIVSLLWINIRKDSNEVEDVAVLVGSEDGQVLGTSTQDPIYLADLADRLKKTGYVIYGSNTDYGSKRQKEIFSQAIAGLDYVECSPGFDNSNPDECIAKGIDEYPTWVRGEEKFPGYKSLDELEELITFSHR